MQQDDRHRPAIVQVYEHKPAFDETKPVEQIQLDLQVSELRTARGWRRELRKQLEGEGRKVLAINVLSVPRDGADVAATVLSDHPGKRTRRPPVTRGGRPVGEPQKLRTMATKRRGG